ncbi:hypothetical protein D3C81_1077940 [compost metagenome]
MQVAVDKHGGDLGGGDQVAQVVVDLVGFIDLGLELVVDRQQFLVDGLQLFLAGFQLFAGQAQLFVDRLHFFVRGHQLLAGDVGLLDGFLQLLTGTLQFALQGAQHHAFGLLNGRRVVGISFANLENHQQAFAATGFVLVGLYLYLDFDALIVDGDDHCARADRLAGVLSLQQGTAQGRAQRREYQVEQAGADFATGVAQEAADTIAHVQDVAVSIDDQAGRCAPGQRPVMDFSIGQLAQGLGFGAYCWRVGRLKPPRAARRFHFPGAEDAMALVHGNKQVGRHVR